MKLNHQYFYQLYEKKNERIKELLFFQNDRKTLTTFGL